MLKPAKIGRFCNNSMELQTTIRYKGDLYLIDVHAEQACSEVRRFLDSLRDNTEEVLSEYLYLCKLENREVECFANSIIITDPDVQGNDRFKTVCFLDDVKLVSTHIFGNGEFYKRELSTYIDDKKLRHISRRCIGKVRIQRIREINTWRFNQKNDACVKRHSDSEYLQDMFGLAWGFELGLFLLGQDCEVTYSGERDKFYITSTDSPRNKYRVGVSLDLTYENCTKEGIEELDKALKNETY